MFSKIEQVLRALWALGKDTTSTFKTKTLLNNYEIYQWAFQNE